MGVKTASPSVMTTSGAQPLKEYEYSGVLSLEGIIPRKIGLAPLYTVSLCRIVPCSS